MRRTNLPLVLTSSAVAVALVALAYSRIDAHSSSATGAEPERRQAEHTQQASHTEVDLNESIATQRSSDAKEQTTAVVFLPGGHVADESTTREIMREDATADIRRLYALLVDDLELTTRERDALFALLAEDRIASTATPYNPAETIDREEQSRRIAAIIGERKLQHFRELENNLRAYAEVQNIGIMLQRNDVPLNETQRDGLLNILIETQDKYAEAPPPPDVGRDSIESLEHQLTQVGEYERHVVELAPSVLSAEQTVFMHEQYQYLSYWRVNALEQQRKERMDGGEYGPLWYPAWAE